MKSPAKKYYYSDLEKYDVENNDSFIRLLEMNVDSVVPQLGYSVQFWRDVKLYGVDEAIAYLKEVINEEQLIELLNCWEKQIEKMTSTKS